MGKKKNKAAKGGKKNPKDQAHFDRLIQSVSDAEVAIFRCEIPSDEELDGLKFPNVVVKPPTIRSLTTFPKGREWTSEWFALLIDREESMNFAFSKASEEQQKMHIDQMVEDMRKSKRGLKWRKYQYALQKKRDSALGRMGSGDLEAKASGIVLSSKDIGEEKAETSDFGEEEARSVGVGSKEIGEEEASAIGGGDPMSEREWEQEWELYDSQYDVSPAVC